LCWPDRPPSDRITGQPGTRGIKEHDMALFTDFHEDLKLPPGAIAQITEHTRTWRADQFGVRQIELDHDARGQVYCLRCSQQARPGRRP
jgi:hypothetical protein